MGNLELRMYGLVAYQLSGSIHAGIQFGHAVVEYGRLCDSIEIQQKLYNDWADNWKTFIILNGGTTNTKISLTDGMPLGSLNKRMFTLLEIGIPFATFYEPDLGDQLTAIVFIVDERVFKKTKYPDPVLMDEFEIDWTEGIEEGELDKIFRLREFLSNFRLA
jgi:hypothetical protein